MLTRRALLQSSGLMAFAAGVASPMFFARAAQAGTANGTMNGKVLVVVYQRFGMDGLLAVTPYTNASLAALRPDLMLPAPDSGKENALIDLGEGYGLNPHLAALAPLYKDGHLAFIQAAGSPDPTRSHLDAAQNWENGTPGNKATPDGWLNRAMQVNAASNSSLRAVAMTAEQPRALYGREPAVAITELNQLELGLDRASAHADVLRQLEAQYREAPAQLRSSAERAFAVSRTLSTTQREAGTYPTTSFGNSMRDIATLIKAGVGLQVAFAESRTGTDGKGSWDTHSYALDAGQQFGFNAIAEDFSRSIAAFWQDLGAQRDNVVLVTHTDFGRNVPQNDKRGTDHGRATTMMVLGTQLDAGVHGALPERFDRDALEDRMDLPVTIDYRAVLSSIAGMQLGIGTEQDRLVFPGFTGQRFSLARS